jgi:hypothetical protein
MIIIVPRFWGMSVKRFTPEVVQLTRRAFRPAGEPAERALTGGVISVKQRVQCSRCFINVAAQGV